MPDIGLGGLRTHQRLNPCGAMQTKSSTSATRLSTGEFLQLRNSDQT